MLVNTCVAVPVATAAGSPLVSYVIKFPSVPPAIFASVIALSETVVAVEAVEEFPDNAPENVVAYNVALLASNVKLVFVFAS